MHLHRIALAYVTAVTLAIGFACKPPAQAPAPAAIKRPLATAAPSRGTNPYRYGDEDTSSSKKKSSSDDGTGTDDGSDSKGDVIDASPTASPAASSSSSTLATLAPLALGVLSAFIPGAGLGLYGGGLSSFGGLGYPGVYGGLSYGGGISYGANFGGLSYGVSYGGGISYGVSYGGGISYGASYNGPALTGTNVELR